MQKLQKHEELKAPQLEPDPCPQHSALSLSSYVNFKLLNNYLL